MLSKHGLCGCGWKSFFVRGQILLALLMISGITNADQIHLKDGSMVIGEIQKMVDGKITLQTSFAGEITIPITEVNQITTEAIKPVHLHDGSIIQGTIDMKSPEQVQVIQKQGEAGITVNTSEVVSINPPAPEPARWKGEIIGNLGITTGNSETKAVGVSADLNKRTDDDRINLRGGYYYTEDDSKGTRDDQFILGKYDYFFDKQLFGYLTSRLDRDAIRDMNLRTTGGAGAGYQFLETDILNLFGEAGISYVNEDYGSDVDDKNYVAGRTAAHFSWWILKERLQFKEDLEVLLGIEDINDWYSISETALTWKWNQKWSTNAGVRFEYDNTPSTGYERADIKYTLGVGYSF